LTEDRQPALSKWSAPPGRTTTGQGGPGLVRAIRPPFAQCPPWSLKAIPP